MNKDVVLSLQKVGVPSHTLGYDYLKEALEICLSDASAIHMVTKCLYPTVAVRHDSTPGRVERAIRHAIATAWDRCTPAIRMDVFGPIVGYRVDPPTNSEFIAVFAEHLRMQLSA